MRRFLSDPNRGRPRSQLFSTENPGKEETQDSVIEQNSSYADQEHHTDNAISEFKERGNQQRRGGGAHDSAAKTVDVVLSDMSAPWEQTTGFWKRSLSDPYIRMMNTSGINFKDHAGSMVCFCSSYI